MHGLDVIVELTATLELAFTKLALEIGHLQMRHLHVTPPIGALSKTRVAQITLKGSLPGVNAFVLHENSATSAHLATIRAREFRL